MRVAVAAMLSALTAACAHAPVATPPILNAAYLREFVLCGGDRREPPPEAAAIAGSAGRVQRRGEVLQVGRTQLRNNYEEGGAYAEYMYVGRLADAPFDLVYVTLYEGDDWAVVDDRGRVTLLGSVPMISPDGTLLAVAANGDPHYGSSVAVYGIGPAGLAPLFSEAIYPPCGGRWESADRFGFATYVEFADIDPNAAVRPAALIRENGAWRYDGMTAPTN